MAEPTLPPNGPDNLVLRYLRRIDERLDNLDRRVTRIERRLDLVEIASIDEP